ncbi:hypothetical protein ACW95P_02990 [Candidatus Mycoplasma pogonae]
MTKKSLLLVSLGTIATLGLVGGIIGTSVAISNNKAANAVKTDPNSYHIGKLNEIKEIKGVTPVNPKYPFSFQPIPNSFNVKVTFKGLANEKTYTLKYELVSTLDDNKKPADIVSNSSKNGEATFTIPDFKFGSDNNYAYTLFEETATADGAKENKEVAKGTDLAFASDKPVVSAIAGVNNVQFKIKNITTYAGIPGVKLQLEYRRKLANNNDNWNMVVGPFDLSSSQDIFEWKLVTNLSAGTEYEYRLTRFDTKIEITKGDFTTLTQSRS